ncbi:MAG TPA: serine/threonine-protein kinase [Polyangiaceae bacterium]|nr:serine/threonine-protein kinase [Polyangiaceae bacterium]
MPEPNEDRPGRILSGRYELLEVLGKGGMAVVWRGLLHGADGFRRPVAIKRIDPSCRGFIEVIEMFVEEARVGGLLQHPNIVQVYEFGADEAGERYLVSELVRGPNLGQWLKAYQEDRELPPWELVTQIAVEVLRGLDAAHSHVDARGASAPILHRDVTPGNILIDAAGIVKLADFGLARAMDRGQITRPNIVKGKLSYLAPELLAGGPPSMAADTFSLGVVLWEALAGRRLFQAETDIEVVELVRQCRVPLLSRERTSLPLTLCSCVHQALERDPRRRYASARQMLEQLSEVLRILPQNVDARSLATSLRKVPALIDSDLLQPASPHAGGPP